MSLLAETATLVHGYTMAQIDDIARHAVHSSRESLVLDQGDRWESAWYGVVEHLYSAETRPERSDLLFAGRRALSRATREQWHHNGMNKALGDVGPKFAKYWLPVVGPRDDFTEQLIERLALPQVLAQLTAAEYEALTALAAHGTSAAGADAIGISRAAFAARLRGAREKILRAWLEGESPWALRKVDHTKECRAGHDRAEHSYTDANSGRTICRICLRNSQRRQQARGDRTKQRRPAA